MDQKCPLACGKAIWKLEKASGHCGLYNENSIVILIFPYTLSIVDSHFWKES